MHRERPVISYTNYYALGYYPSEKIDFNKKYCRVDLVDDLHYSKNEDLDLLPNKSEFNITNEKFSFPTIIDGKLELKTYNVYRATTEKGIEIKTIKYNNEWFRIDPVIWRKIGDDLVCTSILFESPVHMKNDYVKNDDIQSFDDTFLKWYIDNIFTKDLFKYVDYNSIIERMIFSMDEDIITKLKEFERLKQIKVNLILQQQNQERLNDIMERNIASIEDEKIDLQTKLKHR